MRAEIARVSPLKNEPLDANVPKNAGVVVDAYELQAQVVLHIFGELIIVIPAFRESGENTTLGYTVNKAEKSLSECASCY